MSQLDPFDLVRRLGSAPLGPLVKTLRTIHAGGNGDATRLEALLDAGNATPPAPVPPTDTPTTTASYEAARKHFVRHAERLREQALLTERLLDGLSGEARRTPAILQQELRVQCRPGATSAGRFIVANCLAQPVDVRFRTGHFHRLSPGQAASAHLSFSPSAPRLEPSTEQEIDVQVDLRATDDLPEFLEVGVDVLGGDELLLKLWVRIEVRQGGVA